MLQACRPLRFPQMDWLTLYTRSTKPAIISLFLCLSLSAPLLTVILILFGAPLTTHFWHNLLCATHISLLGVLPLFYVHGVNARMWREISGACLPFDEVWGGLVGAIVGAWLGAVSWKAFPMDRFNKR